MDSSVLNNSIVCSVYVPGSSELYHALDWIWILFICIGSISCLVLYGLFTEQVFFVVENSHHIFRKYILWVVSVYPFMALMSVIAFAVPRAGAVCTGAKLLYMMIGISNFADLTLLMYGSEDVMVWTLRDSLLSYDVDPLCCFFCLPKVPVSKVKLRFILAGIYQLPFSQAFYSLMVLILASEDQISVGSIDPRGSYVWLQTFIFIMSLIGIYCMTILSTVSEEYLGKYNYNYKSFALKALIFTVTVQGALFDILNHYDVFPCSPPISPQMYKDLVENAIFIIEMAIFGSISYYLYRKVEFREPNPTTVAAHGRRILSWERGSQQPTVGTAPRYSGSGVAFPGTDFIDDLIDVRDNSNSSQTRQDRFDFSGATLVIDTADYNHEAEEISQDASFYEAMKRQYAYHKFNN